MKRRKWLKDTDDDDDDEQRRMEKVYRNSDPPDIVDKSRVSI